MGRVANRSNYIPQFSCASTTYLCGLWNEVWMAATIPSSQRLFRDKYPYITGLESVRSISQTHVQYIKCVCAWLFLQPLPYMDMTESSIYPIVNNKYPSGCYRISTQPIVTFDSTCCPVSATTKAGSNDNQTPPEPAVLVSGEKDGLHEMWC